MSTLRQMWEQITACILLLSAALLILAVSAVIAVPVFICAALKFHI